MWKLIALLFFVTTVICAYKWLTTRLTLDILLVHTQRKGCAPPNENEMRECTEHVYNCMMKRIFRK